MSSEGLKKKFVEQVKLRAYDDKYVDKAEEKEILTSAIDDGISVASARAVLMQVCEQNGYILESKLVADAKDLLDTFVGNDGKVDEKEFNDTVATLRKRVDGKKTDLELKRLLLTMMQEHQMRAKTGMMSNWHKKALKEAGLA